ncbi:DNA/RNA non-specific endonuclease [Rheinheimera sp. UJ51]|uniref:DNA/RNA non-specific endonuclease n=1 Tax=Rheinheimera sp. UJ51 TaxID=2892446 RepID=UPI001E285362|nr:DNA/RNA non-specific endonuclease [Rheinheimera sp. UJ51]MCC5453125.1 DNA/RNA non-specific endonuclease [Rheinheimera sp. UJ51]
MGYISYPRSAGERLDRQRVQEVIRLIEGLADIVMPSTLDGILALLNQIGWHNLPPHIKAKLLALMRKQLYPKLDPQITSKPVEHQSYRTDIQSLNSLMVELGLSISEDTGLPLHERLNATGLFNLRLAQSDSSGANTPPILIDSNGMTLTVIEDDKEVIENQGLAITQAIYAYPDDADVLQQSYLSGKHSTYYLENSNRGDVIDAVDSSASTLAKENLNTEKSLYNKDVDEVKSEDEADSTDKGSDVIKELEPGSKGSWNKALNGKLEPNHKYKVGEHLYETDDHGRVTRVSGVLHLTKRDRNTYQQGKSAKEGGIKDGLANDDGGHIIASVLDGAGEQINYVPMDSNLNRGVWKQMENIWAKALKGPPPQQVKVDIQPVYEGESKRPVAFSVKYWIDGRHSTAHFENKPGG